MYFSFELLQNCSNSINAFPPFKLLDRSDRGKLIMNSWVPMFLIDLVHHGFELNLELKNFCNLPNAVSCHQQAMCANEISQCLAEVQNLPTTETARTLKTALQNASTLKLGRAESFYLKLFVLFNGGKNSTLKSSIFHIIRPRFMIVFITSE